MIVFAGHRGRSWWSPAPVLWTRRTRSGTVEVTTLRDQSMEVLDADEMESGLPDLLLTNTGYLTDDLKRAALDQWGLELWCPGCGGLGNPILYGMPAGDPNNVYDDDGFLRPWPAGSYDVAGCVVDGFEPGYRCHRCGTEWGAELGRWRRASHAATFDDLLRRAACADVEELEELLQDYASHAVRIEFDGLTDLDSDFAVHVGSYATDLRFPLTIPELWDVIDGREQDIQDVWTMEHPEDIEEAVPPRPPRPRFAQWPRPRARG